MRYRAITILLPLVLSACVESTKSASESVAVTAADYARAEALVSHNIGRLARNESLSVRWPEGDDHLEYIREVAHGEERVRVEAGSGRRDVLPNDTVAVDGAPAESAMPGHLVSPDGARTAFIQGHNPLDRGYKDGRTAAAHVGWYSVPRIRRLPRTSFDSRR